VRRVDTSGATLGQFEFYRGSQGVNHLCEKPLPLELSCWHSLRLPRVGIQRTQK